MAANSNAVGIWNGARKDMEEQGWLVVRTLGGGTQAMRDARDVFTPRTEKEVRRPLDYEARLQRSTLFPAYAKTVAKLASLPFAKAYRRRPRPSPKLDPVWHPPPTRHRPPRSLLPLLPRLSLRLRSQRPSLLQRLAPRRPQRR
jgi:hypothetical protein